MNSSYVPCPHCGAEIKANAKFCRHCGSSESDGWRDDSFGDLGDEIDDFDYEEFVNENFSDSPVNTQTALLWRWVAIALLILFALSFWLW